MLSNFFRTLLRVSQKQISYSWLNILGFSLGISAAFIIAVYVFLELSYDKFNTKADRIVRVTEMIRPSGVGQASASVPIPVGPALQQDFPHLVEASVRFFRFESPLMFSRGESKFNEHDILFSDQSVFQVFDVRLIEGVDRNALTLPNQIVLTESLAKKYFQTGDAVGRVLRYDDKIDLQVTAVIDDLPSTSHIQASAFISFETLKGVLTERQITSWFWNPAYTYALLRDNVRPVDLAASLDGFMKKYFNESKYKNKSLELQQLTKIHLTSDFDNELEPAGSLTYLNMVTIIGAFILLLAIINFINLSTARAMHRAKEVGVRKVLGSLRSQVVFQFLLEAWIFTFVATAIGLLIGVLTLPAINQYLGLNLELNSSNMFLLYLAIPFALITGFAAGIYPAVYLSSFKPIQVLKGKLVNRKGGGLLRQALVVGQFVVTITLSIASIVVASQFDFMRSQNLGFDKSNVIIVPVQRSAIGEIENYKLFRERLLQEPGVKSVTAFENIVGIAHNSGSYTPEGTSEPVLYPRLFVRESFTEMLGIEILAGKAFSENQNANSDREVMINESMVKSLGWISPEEAVGKKMGEIPRDSGAAAVRVVGVFKDFNFVSLHEAVGPLVLEGPPTTDAVNLFMIKYIGIRIEQGTLSMTLDKIRSQWDNLSGNKIFEYSLLDDELNKTYAYENKLMKLNNLFSILAIVVSCLGLIGLASFTMEQRMKEVSIRKVLGSSVSAIAVMLTRYYLKILVVASFLAVPLAYFSLNSWLGNFAYRIEITWLHVFTAIGITLLISLLTVARQTIKAALVNPGRTLRSE